MSDNEAKAPTFRFRLIGKIIRFSGLGYTTLVFLAIFVVSAILIAFLDPETGGIGNSLWFCFQVVTTIGFGDVVITSLLGRVIAVILSLASIFLLAVLTAAVVSYCSEALKARRDESIALFVDKLERLPELSTEELAQISDTVKHFNRK